MAVHANSLTERVTPPTGTPAHIWSMPANHVAALMDALGRLGYGSESLLATIGLREADLRDPDARIPCEALGALVSLAQQERFTPNLALEVARVTPLGAYPLLDYLVITSDTVEGAVQHLARYLRLVGNPVSMEVQEHDGCVCLDMANAAAPFSVEFVTSLMLLHLRAETDGRFAASRVTFAHRVDDPALFEQVLGCPIQPASSWNRIWLTHDALQLPLRRRDAVLHQLLETQASEFLARTPTRTGLAVQVQHALASRAAGGDTSIGAIGRELGMSGRTLQRRLAAEGLSYRELVNAVRKEAAGRYLSASTFAISEVAYLVGYSEPAPFHRAFKRWFGVTPDAFRRSRREHRPDPPSSVA